MLIIFDVDGVLEKEETIMKVRKTAQLQAVADKLEVSVDEALKQYELAREKLPLKLRRTSASVFGTFGFTRKEYFAVLDSVDPEGIIEPHEHCVEMLDKIKEGNVLVALTNTPYKATLRTLEVLGITPYFSKIYSSEQFNESKPSVNILNTILKEQGFDVADAMMVGNSMAKDIAPAVDIGMKAVLFDPFEKNKDYSPRINDLIELVD